MLPESCIFSLPEGRECISHKKVYSSQLLQQIIEADKGHGVVHLSRCLFQTWAQQRHPTAPGQHTATPHQSIEDLIGALKVRVHPLVPLEDTVLLPSAKLDMSSRAAPLHSAAACRAVNSCIGTGIGLSRGS